MNLQVVYCNHHTAGLDVRERLAFAGDDQLQRAYRTLQQKFPGSETVVVSTCNRVELYTAQEEADPPTQRQIAEFLADFHSIPVDAFFDDLLEQRGPETVRHLFRVVSSLDSMVLGEPQIVSQVKQAYETARDNDACGPLTNALFQGALRVSSRVRTETSLAEGRVSIASVAVGEFGKSIFDSFHDKTILVIGAGEMAEETLRYLKDEGVGRIVVVNRSLDRAEQLASHWGGESRPYEELDDCLSLADVVVSTTGADRPIIDAARFKPIRKQSRYRPVFILDLGAPRDFDPAVADLDDNVFLFDIDALEETCRRNRTRRVKEMESAAVIVEAEAERFMHEFYHRATGPIIRRLREEWHEIRRQEVDQLLAKMPHLTAEDKHNIERTVERVVNKLLHPPLSALRSESKSGSPHSLVEALKRLFHLGGE